ncbi:MAG TPA: substrate-binding domain-containing protein [Terracidiphilus sp.]|nr:substrate-binding domain-containing protein [Terracidiphilus sp.]
MPLRIHTSIRDYKSAEDAIAGMLADANPPDALFTRKNSTTIFAFEALQKLGVPVPKKMALLSFDDFERTSTVRPSITAVQQPVEEIGRVTAEMLFAQLFGAGNEDEAGGSRKGRHATLETRLIRRAPCGCTPSFGAD